MASVNVLKFGVSSPADTTPLEELKAAGYEAKDILGVVGKSEGANTSHFWPTTLTIQGTAASTTSHEH
jgi:cyanuric acid amidohydrolase